MVADDSLGPWKIAGQGLRTVWSESVNPNNVLPHYPRPQLVRDRWLNLNGLWQYTVVPKEQTKDQVEFNTDQHILVPFPIESALSGVKKTVNPDQRLWYKVNFNIPNDWNDQVILHFGAVDWHSEVWINGQFIGEHKGGYCSFSFNITEALIEQGQELVIAVWDPTDDGQQERGKQALNPHGLFYTAVTGIWQTVWLEPVHKKAIGSIYCVADIDNSALTTTLVSLQPELNTLHGMAITIQLSFHNQTIHKSVIKINEECSFTISVPNMQLWSPDQPNLYEISIQLWDEEQVIDRISSYCGMRKLSVSTNSDGVKTLLLNNKPIFQHGVLDQGYWPDGLYTAPSDEALVHDINAMKRLGFNMLRKHIKVECARWYYHCDRLGMLVWQDMINGGGKWDIWNQVVIPNILPTMLRRDDTIISYRRYGRIDLSSRLQYEHELKEMVDQLRCFTSIVLWCPFNEAWGQFDSARIAKWLHEYDPSRFVDHASGWYDQQIGEIKSIHIYFRKLSMPKNTDNKAVVISEYGGYNLYIREHTEPIRKQTGYKRCRSYEELSDAYRSLMQEQLLPLVKRGVCAAVYTQLSDVESEVNGLLTYDRKVVKVDAEVFYPIHQELYDSILKFTQS